MRPAAESIARIRHLAATAHRAVEDLGGEDGAARSVVLRARLLHSLASPLTARDLPAGLSRRYADRARRAGVLVDDVLAAEALEQAEAAAASLGGDKSRARAVARNMHRHRERRAARNARRDLLGRPIR